MPKRDRAAVSQQLSQILGGSDATDLLQNVIQSDRHKAGRAMPAPEPDTMTSRTVISQYGHDTSTRSDHKTSNLADKHVTSVAFPQADATEEVLSVPTRTRQRSTYQKQDPGGLRARRVAEAKRMAASTTTTVTLRLPRELNDWLDEYVHRAWPERVRKQELVIEALRILFARRGRPGEPILKTGLLLEDAP
jgi:hypothetical protein